MRWLIRPRRSATTLIAAVATVVIAAGAAYAATGGFAGSARAARAERIYACVATTVKTLNLSSAAATCPSGEQKISWNAVGPSGPPGRRGSAGRRGTAGRTGASGIAGATGQSGAQGPAGTAGPGGATGATGAQGPTGAAGTNGTNGTNGINGATGPTGLTGPTGATGALSSAYLDAYTSTSQGVPNGSPYPFDTLQAASGITASGANNTTFRVTSAGKYLVIVALLSPGGSWQLQVNGTPVGPNFGASGNCASSDCTFSRILSLNAADAISVVNTSPSSEADLIDSGITIARIA
jgi:hypothetical protein